MPKSKKIPEVIPKPDYAIDGIASYNQLLGIPHSEVLYEKHKKGIHINTHEEIEGIRKACRLARTILDEAHKVVGVGVTTEEIDKKVFELSVEHGAYPSPLNYYSFPKSVCTYKITLSML